MIISLISIALICIILTLVLIKKDKTRFTNGIILELAIMLLISAIYMLIYNANFIASIQFVFIDIMKYVTYFIAILFIYNGIYNTINPKRIRKNNVTDLLSLLAGIALIMINILIIGKEQILYKLINIILIYIDIMFIGYILNSIIYKISTKRVEPDVIIILGAGLVDGIKPSRTLLKRLEKAIEIYNLNNNSYIIPSGGQGLDEKISEAEAMKRYLVEKGIDKEKIILEDKSRNTYENLKFSREKIENLKMEKSPKIVFISSDFHIYRAANYAKRVNIKADGIGGKTLYHYYPAALIREFAAIFVSFIRR